MGRIDTAVAHALAEHDLPKRKTGSKLVLTRTKDGWTIGVGRKRVRVALAVLGYCACCDALITPGSGTACYCVDGTCEDCQYDAVQAEVEQRVRRYLKARRA